ncbi:hypothetical protein CSUI_008214 [Cystoisospora suis]|uniref:Uncharacterized protein n=1 Tax=Cystoisospora suis TaxID=483139 RepID=A0A2C6KAL3_9APIC|nr:hypothetical protein CSUI_008214 [Cystoisospora suis]
MLMLPPCTTGLTTRDSAAPAMTRSYQHSQTLRKSRSTRP